MGESKSEEVEEGFSFQDVGNSAFIIVTFSSNRKKLKFDGN